jgi:multiple sugar transport system ATP-binding protein
VVLLGPSGCGKTTTLRAIAGLEDIDSGDILIDGKPVQHLHAADRDIAFVFQNYSLYPYLDVAANIAFPLRVSRVRKEERERRTREVAELLGLEPYLERKPGQLSGGQRQRVAMGRAIVRNPDLFLFDDPLSNLDAKLRVEMRTEIKRLHDTLGSTVVYVTHDQLEAMTLGTLVAVMKDGILQQLDDPQVIYDRPANMFVAGFIGSPAMNFIDATVAGTGDDPELRLSDGQRFSIEWDPAAHAAWSGKTVIAGIRPEAFSSCPVESACVKGRVEVVEPTGPDTMVVVDIAGTKVTVRLGARERPAPGQTLGLRIAPAVLSLFDPASTHSIA